MIERLSVKSSLPILSAPENAAVKGGVTAKNRKKHRKTKRDSFHFSRETASSSPAAPETESRLKTSVPPSPDPIELLKVDRVREKYGLTGKGITVAVVDSGLNHPEKTLKGWQDLTGEDATHPVDPWGHGTHVSGNLVNVAPEADLVGIRIINGKGASSPAKIVEAIQWAIENKDQYDIKILNLSMGWLPNPYGIPNPVEGAAYEAVKAGIVVISSAGNEGPCSGSISLPANQPEVIAVGSARDARNLSESSSRGPALGWLEKPDVVAPGDHVKSWAAPDSALVKKAVESANIRAMSPDEVRKTIQKDKQLRSELHLPDNFDALTIKEQAEKVKANLPELYLTDDHQLIMSGTSFAAPQICGVAALMLEANDKLTPKQVLTILRETARPLGDKSLGPNDQGKGMVDAEAAVKRALELKENAAKEQK